MFFGVGARQRDKVGNLRAERPDVNILILGVGFYAPTGAVCCIELHRIKSIFRGCNLGVSGVAALYRQEEDYEDCFHEVQRPGSPAALTTRSGGRDVGWNRWLDGTARQLGFDMSQHGLYLPCFVS